MAESKVREMSVKDGESPWPSQRCNNVTSSYFNTCLSRIQTHTLGACFALAPAERKEKLERVGACNRVQWEIRVK